jgi:phosphatidylinositol-3-phosphatase
MLARQHIRAWFAAGLVALLALPAARAAETLPPIHHVFVIVLENEGFDKTFGPKSEAPYLAKSLPAQGALLQQYFGTGHASLDNYLAMISGQAASSETRADCGIFADFVQTGTTPDGQAIGHGCVYPATIKTLADQLTKAGLGWRGYMEDMGNDPQREATSCGHAPIGEKDPTHRAEPPSTAVPKGDQYAARHDPFVYFHSVLDSPDCAKNVIRLEQLPADLKTVATTPEFSFITPNLCHDGHDEPCKNGEHGGLESADGFLKHWVPIITAAPAFKLDGLLIVTFDESDESSVAAKPEGGHIYTFDGASCCNQQPGPNLAAFPQHQSFGADEYVMGSFGGDRIGAVLLSRFIKPGTVSKTGYNHYSLLRSVEDLFHLDGHLGYAGQDGLASFGPDIFTRVAKR